MLPKAVALWIPQFHTLYTNNTESLKLLVLPHILNLLSEVEIMDRQRINKWAKDSAPTSHATSIGNEFYFMGITILTTFSQ